MTWLTLGLVLTVASVPQYGVGLRVVNPEPAVSWAEAPGVYRTTVALDATAWGLVRVYGDVDTLMAKYPGANAFFVPFSSGYHIGVEVLLGGHLAAGIRHECVHPVDSTMRSTHPVLFGPESTITEVYASFRAKVTW